MIRYAITDRSRFPGDEAAKQAALVQQALRLAHAKVDFVQVREKDLTFAKSAELALRLCGEIEAAAGQTQVLLNAPWPPRIAPRSSVQASSGAPASWPAGIGIHLPSSAVGKLNETPAALANLRATAVVSAACHTLEEAMQACGYANLLLFAPVFEKRVSGTLVRTGSGLPLLAQVCRAVAPLPVLAMGGVTLQNAVHCVDAGAAGIAGIRLFLE